MFESRALYWNSPELAKLLKKEFVVVSYPGVYGGNALRVLTPEGKDLTPPGGYPSASAAAALKAWRSLPAAARKPDPKKKLPTLSFAAPPAPPAGGLILKVYIRGLQRDAKGKVSRNDGYLLQGGLGGTLPPEPQADFLWMTKAEWQSLLPARPRKGSKVEVPAALVERIATYHLRDLAFNHGPYWSDYVGKASPTVTAVTPAYTRMSLKGVVELSGKGGPLVDLLGSLTYDAKAKVFTQFDMVAVSRGTMEFRSEAARTKKHAVCYKVKKGS